MHHAKPKKKRGENVLERAAPSASTAEFKTLFIYNKVYNLIDEVCTPTGRLSPAVAAAQTYPGVVAFTLLSHKGAATPPPLLLHHHHHNPQQAWLFSIWLQEQRGHWRDDSWETVRSALLCLVVTSRPAWGPHA